MRTTLKLTLSAIFAVTVLAGCATEGNKKSHQVAQECVVKDGKLLAASGQPMTGCVMMHNGKMMVMDGKLKLMKKNMTMANGTVCMVNGTCVMKNGTKVKLREGDIISPTAGATLFHAKGLKVPGER